MKNKKTTAANKKGFLKYFPDKKADIEQYLQEHKNFNFSKKADLLDLFAFLNQ